MSSVVHLRGKGPINPTSELGPVPDVIEGLEKALAKAKDGKIRAVGIACVEDGGIASTAWFMHPDECTAHQLLAAMTYMQGRFLQHRLDGHIDEK